jgi:hypothetical protein
MYHSHSHWSGTTGRLLEREFIDVTKIGITWNGEYITYRRSMEEIITKQSPNSALNVEGKRLRDAIAWSLQVFPYEVEVFGSFHTCLDEKHGIDLIVRFKGVVVTIDVTMNPQKRSAAADFIVSTEEIDDGYKAVARDIGWALTRSAVA